MELRENVKIEVNNYGVVEGNVVQLSLTVRVEMEPTTNLSPNMGEILLFLSL